MDAIINFFIYKVTPWFLSLIMFFFPVMTAQSGAGSAEPVYNIVDVEGVSMAEITLLTYNVKNCQNGTAIKQIAGEIAATGAQIVFLQEIDNGIVRSFFLDEAKLLAAELGFSYAFFPALKVAGGLYGNAILSAFPLSGAAVTALPIIGDIETRAYGQADIVVEGVPVRLFVTHLSSGSHESRLLQLAELDKAINASPGGSFLLGGDFNVSSYDNYALLTNAVPAHTAETQPPYASRIDNIFCDPSKALINVRGIPTGYSDHNLVLAEVLIPLG